MSDLKPDTEGSLEVSIAPITPDSESTGWQSITIEVADVGLGGLQFSLFWDAPVDMDLIVVDPAGTIIDFETPSANGGQLNLDANALCAIGAANAENVSWNIGEATVGAYEVRVNLFDSCGYTGDIHWEVVATSAGTAQVAIVDDAKPGEALSGKSLTGTISSSSTDTSGVGVPAGPVAVASAQSVGGVVMFKKQTRSGLVDQVLRYAPVRAVAEDSAKTVLGVGMTNDVGAYDVSVLNPTGEQFRVVVEASYSGTSPGAALAVVVPPGSAEPYTFEGPTITPRDGSSHLQNLSIAPSDDSGAFNILDNMREGYSWVADQGKLGALGPLSASWKAGDKNGGSAYTHSTREYRIQGQASDPDEFDDSVIMHEFMHFVHNTLSFSGPGGGHSGRVAPDLAFKEGFASLLAQHVLNTPLFIDKTASPSIASITDLESDANPLFKDTSDHTVTGRVSEWLTAMLVWDLMDSGSGEPHDKIHAPNTVIKTFLDELPLGIEEVVTAWKSPWQNPFVERMIGSTRRECLDHIIILNERHLRRILRSYFAYYHESRTHLALGKNAPEPRPVQGPEMGKVVALPQVGGLHHRYERRAA